MIDRYENKALYLLISLSFCEGRKRDGAAWIWSSSSRLRGGTSLTSVAWGVEV